MRVALIIYFLVVCFKISGQTKLELYNNTDDLIYVALVKYSKADACWISEGWYTVDEYNSRTFDLGNYQGSVYLRGRQGLLTEWGKGDGYFCVDADEAFKIKYANTKDCWSKKPFTEKKVSTGLNKFTFN